MWRQISNTDEAAQWWRVLDKTDPAVYQYTKDEAELNLRVGQSLENQKIYQSQYWYYEDGEAQAAICAQPDKGALRIISFCATGFDPDLFANWKIAYPILCAKCREICDELGLKDSHGYVPMTDNGKCIVYFAQTMAWEQTTLDITKEGDTYKLQFSRDPQLKPVDEAIFESGKEATVIPDAKAVYDAAVAAIAIGGAPEKIIP